MYDGYIELGGDELANVARFKAYIDGAQGFPWVKVISEGETTALREALGDAPYTTPAGDNAPWYDPGNPASANFHGIYISGIDGDEGSTRSSTVTEGVLSGGTASSPREGTREMRFTAILAARDELAMEAGLQWLNRTLDPEDCAGDDCGAMVLCGYAAAPQWLDNCLEYDYTAAQTRTNETIDPMFVNGGTYWTLTNGSLSSSSIANYHSTAAQPVGTPLLYQTTAIAGTAGDVVSGRMTITNRNDYTVDFFLQIASYGLAGTLGSTNGATVTLAPGETKNLFVDGAVLSAAATGYRMILRSSATNILPLGAQLRVSRAQTIKATTAGTFFYGGGTPEVGRSNAWVGLANASASLQYVAGVSPGRHLNEITTISGATVTGSGSFPGGVYREVEFGLVAGTPWFFTDPMRVLDGSTAASGTTRYYDDGALVAINHLNDPRAKVAGNWSYGGGTAGTLAFSVNQPITAGIPPWTNGDNLTMRWTATGAGPNVDVYAQNTLPFPMRVVSPLRRYIASVHVTANFPGTAALRMVWYDAAGNLLSSTNGPITDITGNSNPIFAAFVRLSVAGDAPAGAAYAVPIVRLTGAAGGALATGNAFYIGWWQVELAPTGPNVIPDVPTDWFDGNSYFGNLFSLFRSERELFKWAGAANASPSYHFRGWLCDYVLYNGFYYSPTYSVLQDPLAGALPPAPTPPPISTNIPVVGLTGWNRSYYTLPAVGSTENGIAVPTITLTPLTPIASTRQIRLRFTANPGNLPPADLDPCDFCAELIVSYLSTMDGASVAFIIDGETQSVDARVFDSVNLAADGYVYGADGGPIVWPELTCGIPYVMTVDQPNSYAMNIGVTVDMTRRI